MSEEEGDRCRIFVVFCLILISGTLVTGDSLETDKVELLKLKSFLEDKNPVNRGRYSEWNMNSSSPCNWPGIKCSSGGNRVTGISLCNNNISGDFYDKFSALTELSSLDLSENTIGGSIPADLSLCKNLQYLNLSHNIIQSELNLTGLNALETLDLSVNRFQGGINANFPAMCNNLITANISGNNFSGAINNCFDQCSKLQHLDLSSNNFTGDFWTGFARLTEFSVGDNQLSGGISDNMFSGGCTLQLLDLSENRFSGEIPKAISNCKNLRSLNFWGNNFSGKIPGEIGSIPTLQALFLGSNNFSSDIPENLLNCSNLSFLDLSNNSFGGEIQEIFGRFTQVNFLVLHGNQYTGGIISSGITNLPSISRLDLSYNNFSGPLPIEIAKMLSLKYLILAFNYFNGSIPSEYGSLPRLQSLDLSNNRLTGPIPSSIGNLGALLWLMLANNSLSGEIPREIGNCGSLLWVHLANNQFTGKIPIELMRIGFNATPTFESNRASEQMVPGSGECLAMKRWIPADYPPFSFIYTLLTRKSCRDIWDRLLKGYGVIPMCAAGSLIQTYQISGYLQLTGNQFTGEIPHEIGNMKNFALFHLGHNDFYGNLPAEISNLPLVVLNISQNKFSGEIPMEIGHLDCLQNLDLSYNNFSGQFPASLNNLTALNKFNISYNPLITGVIPTTGQLATFEKTSYLGDPLLHLPSFINSGPPPPNIKGIRKPSKFSALMVFFALTLAFLAFGVLSIIGCILIKSPIDTPGYLLESSKWRNEYGSSSGGSSPWLTDTVKVIRLDKTAFTHADILKATGNLSDERVIGKGGCGIVYRGVLPDGREVAVKKLQREGIEGEKEFRAEMEVLCGNGFGWPHPNLVALYGWCLDGSEKLLVYEYMEGGSLEDFISDRTRLMWRRRIEVAIDVARALVFLHHECYPAIVHRDVKASNVLLDKNGKARVTDFGLARVVDAGDSHVSTVVAGTVGYVAPEYGQTWQATTKGDVYSFGVLAMELATARRAVDGGEECLVEWARRVMGNGRLGFNRAMTPVVVLGSGLVDGAEEMCELLRVGIKCTAEAPQARPNMKEVLDFLVTVYGNRSRSQSQSRGGTSFGSSSPPSW